MYKYGKKLFRGGDPFLLKHDGIYYVYCTTENDLPAYTDEYPFFETYKENGDDGIEVHISKDLTNWENCGFCLKKEEVLGNHGFWSPEVSYYNGMFYMVYAADEHLAIAVSDGPAGPFKKLTNDWLREFPAIDGHLFFDDDGSIYLYFAALENGNRIKVAKMSDDLTRIEHEYESVLISADKDVQRWETVDGCIAEAPFVLKHNRVYYLTYSSNHVRCPDYAVGYAVSDKPYGPFKKYDNNPILHKFDDIVGTGHHSFAPTEENNRYLCIYHCHSDAHNSFKPRQICLAEAEFAKNPDGGADILVVNQ